MALLKITVTRNYMDKKQHMISQGNTRNGILMTNFAALKLASFTVTPLQVRFLKNNYEKILQADTPINSVFIFPKVAVSKIFWKLFLIAILLLDIPVYPLQYVLDDI